MENVHSFEVWQDGMAVAEAEALNREDALREARHYAAMYGQDGPVEIWEVKRIRAA
jgi:hypothetical protein